MFGNMNMKTKLFHCILCSTLCLMVSFGFIGEALAKTQRVFPGAEGYGTFSRGGRGGRIIRVTNLNDSGSGSLRAALAASGPRIVVFEVGGTIHLNSMLSIKNPFVTVAGQTAPGKGVLIRDSGISIHTNDVLLQHLAIRPGDEGPGPWDTLDGVQIVKPSHHVVIDHCSISWAIDENADTWTDVHDVTFSNCIISEGLRNSLHSDGKHSKGYLAGRRNTNISFIGNLQAHNDTRNPMIYGRTNILIANNVFYNAGAYSFTSVGDGWKDGPPQAVVVGNVFKAGPNTTAGYAIKIESNAPKGTKVYEANNYFRGGKIRGGQQGYYVSSPPLPTSGITLVKSESDILKRVLNNAGARPAQRDAVDNRIANPKTGEVVTGKGSFIDSINRSGKRAPGGWPKYPLEYRNFDAGSNPNGDDNHNGFTNIEEVLHKMAQKLEK
jgi:pectate lyase